MPNADEYQPIACSFYDELGLRMLRGQSCSLVIEGGAQTETLETVIDDIFTEGTAEYIRLGDEKGRCVRLDHIRRVDDVERPGA